jgi:hypothetical protein
MDTQHGNFLSCAFAQFLDGAFAASHDGGRGGMGGSDGAVVVKKKILRYE